MRNMPLSILQAATSSWINRDSEGWIGGRQQHGRIGASLRTHPSFSS